MTVQIASQWLLWWAWQLFSRKTSLILSGKVSAHSLSWPSQGLGGGSQKQGWNTNFWDKKTIGKIWDDMEVNMHICVTFKMWYTEEPLPKTGPPRNSETLFRKDSKWPSVYLSGKDFLTSILFCPEYHSFFCPFLFCQLFSFQLYLLLVSLVQVTLMCSPGFSLSLFSLDWFLMVHFSLRSLF